MAALARDATIWRFMDFTKYVAMLDQRAVYFTRADHFADPFEGTVARRNLPRRRRAPEKTRVYVNCWYRSDHESAAMWRIFLQSAEGVAIRSTAGRLGEALEARSPPVRIAEVRYLDYQREEMDDRDELAPFVHKRKAFDYERELRALIVDDEDEADGMYVRVELPRLLARVIVAPTAESWFRPLVESVSRKYGLEVAVDDSELALPPYDAGR